MLNAIRSNSFLAGRLVVAGALAIGFVGVAHADLGDQTVADPLPLDVVSTVTTSQGAGVATAEQTVIADSGATASIGATNTTLSGSGSNNGGSGRTFNFAPPGATPEPFTVGLAIAGLGMAARRIRRAGR